MRLGILTARARRSISTLCQRGVRSASNPGPLPVERPDRADNDWLRRLITAQEDERGRVARELHDQLGQHLAALLLGIDSIRENNLGTGEAVEHLRTLALTMERDVRRIAHELRPPALDDLGLIDALQMLVDDRSARGGMTAALSVSNMPERLPSDVEIAVYRIVQEALTNIARHARAEQVSVVVERQPDRLVVVVDDDGCGFDVAAAVDYSRHLGILGMRERAKLLGGELTIESVEGRGTSVFVTLPRFARG